MLACKGIRPLVEIHTHTAALTEFSKEGWDASYRRLALLLADHANLLGVMRASWFMDPRISDISPRLAYLRGVPEAGGAHFLYVAEDHRGTSGALATSEHRRRLFDTGHYRPQVHIMIWPRQALLRAFSIK